MNLLTAKSSLNALTSSEKDELLILFLIQLFQNHKPPFTLKPDEFNTTVFDSSGNEVFNFGQKDYLATSFVNLIENLDKD